MRFFLLLLLFIPIRLTAQTDYDQLPNWYFHPEKVFNFIENYGLDIAVIDKNLDVDYVIPIENNAGNNTGVDVFWLHPTELTSAPAFPTAIPLADQNTTLIGGIILAQGALLAKYGRFFAPKYRQASPAAFLGFNFSEEERAEALLDSYSDVKAAFMHYLENYNEGNKIILAGHSQGSFLLGMLIRDVFDNNPQLRDQLVTASLGGMGYVYAKPGSFQGGWWENIPLCTVMNECGCVHFWRSYDEEEDIPEANSTLPSFNQVLVDSGLVYRTTDLANDWLLQDSLFYGTSSSPLRYYITPDASYNLGGEANIIAFDSMYTARFNRESDSEIGLVLDVSQEASDQRPNELIGPSSNPFFSDGDFHVKDYHVYTWALLEQIDAKLEGCSAGPTSSSQATQNEVQVYPNPTTDRITISGELTMHQVEVVGSTGQFHQAFKLSGNVQTIDVSNLPAGLYFLKIQNVTTGVTEIKKVVKE